MPAISFPDAPTYAHMSDMLLARTHECENLKLALESRHLIGLGQGLLMHRYGLDVEASFQVLRRLSSHRNVKLRDVAAKVVDEFLETGSIA
jgi:AmiR/NasT family two-component response regulator